MADILLRGTPITTVGELPEVGSTAADATLVDADLTDVKLSDYSGKKLLLNIFPSIDTGICAQSARTFNEAVAELGDVIRILCISKEGKWTKCVAFLPLLPSVSMPCRGVKVPATQLLGWTKSVA